MVKEEYVSLETARLLKEKEFDGWCHYVWVEGHEIKPELCAAPCFAEGLTAVNRVNVEDVERYIIKFERSDDKITAYLAPTLQMAVLWLMKMHGFYVTSKPDTDGREVFRPRIYKKTEQGWGPLDPSSDGFMNSDFHSPKEACEASLRHCLEDLV